MERNFNLSQENSGSQIQFNGSDDELEAHKSEKNQKVGLRLFFLKFLKAYEDLRYDTS